MLGPLGILGGGQLGRMTLQAASALGIDVVIAERFADSPAARLTSRSVVFRDGWDDARALDELAGMAKVVTLENEFVDAAVLRELEQRGCTVLPSPACVATVQDKLLQKRACARSELPVARFTEDLDSAGVQLGWPLMLKARRDGYDGRGNVLVHSSEEAEAAKARLGRSAYAEQYVPFERELAVIVVRGKDGQVVSYPVVETRQDPRLHICTCVLSPGAVQTEVADRAAAIARGAGGPTTRATTPSRRAAPRSSAITSALCSACPSDRRRCASRRRSWSTSSAPSGPAMWTSPPP